MGQRFVYDSLPGLRIETSTPRTRTRSRGPRTWGTHCRYVPSIRSVVPLCPAFLKSRSNSPIKPV